jgi:hypothetical protein
MNANVRRVTFSDGKVLSIHEIPGGTPFVDGESFHPAVSLERQAAVPREDILATGDIHKIGGESYHLQLHLLAIWYSSRRLRSLISTICCSRSIGRLESIHSSCFAITHAASTALSGGCTLEGDRTRASHQTRGMSVCDLECGRSASMNFSFGDFFAH